MAGQLQVIGEIAGTLQLAPDGFIRARAMACLQPDLDVCKAGGDGHVQSISL